MKSLKKALKRNNCLQQLPLLFSSTPSSFCCSHFPTYFFLYLTKKGILLLSQSLLFSCMSCQTLKYECEKVTQKARNFTKSSSLDTTLQQELGRFSLTQCHTEGSLESRQAFNRQHECPLAHSRGAPHSEGRHLQVCVYIGCVFLCICVCVCGVSSSSNPRYSGTAPADMGTPQWITQGREGFTEEEKEINRGRRYSKKGVVEQRVS